MKLQEVIDKFDSYKSFVMAVNKKIIEIVDKNPNFIYAFSQNCRCSYNGPAIKDDKIAGPQCNGCLFGQVLQSMGWLDHQEMNSGSYISTLFYNYSNSNMCIPDYWRRIQYNQDLGLSWGDSIKEFRKELEE